jgi:hypothetical protein
VTNPHEQEAQRRVLEARGRLREGYVTRAKVDELMQRITKFRGEAAALQLRQDMREQWAKRNEWLDAAGASNQETR